MIAYDDVRMCVVGSGVLTAAAEAALLEALEVDEDVHSPRRHTDHPHTGAAASAAAAAAAAAVALQDRLQVPPQSQPKYSPGDSSARLLSSPLHPAVTSAAAGAAATGQPDLLSGG